MSGTGGLFAGQDRFEPIPLGPPWYWGQDFWLALRLDREHNPSNIMPETSLQKLRESIASAGELTAEHREELLRVAAELEQEVRPIAESSAGDDNLRTAIELAGQLVEQKSSGKGDELRDDLEKAVDQVAIKHPVVAGILTALARLG